MPRRVKISGKKSDLDLAIEKKRKAGKSLNSMIQNNPSAQE